MATRCHYFIPHKRRTCNFHVRGALPDTPKSSRERKRDWPRALLLLRADTPAALAFPALRRVRASSIAATTSISSSSQRRPRQMVEKQGAPQSRQARDTQAGAARAESPVSLAPRTLDSE